jgi:hypothetical protein
MDDLESWQPEYVHDHQPELINPLHGLSYTRCKICHKILDGTPPPPETTVDGGSEHG